MLTKSKRTPVKHSGALRAVCSAHGVTIEDSNLMVCQGRKVVYVLRIGILHSKNCFVREPPTPSYRKESGLSESGWKSIAIPNGWKVALIVDNEVWTAEVSYDHNDRDLAQYRFALIGDNGEIVRQSDWCYTPSGAFKSASSTSEGEDQAWGRHNGKLYLGCTYDYPQAFIRNHFSEILTSSSRESQWTAEVSDALREWLDPAKQTDRSASSLIRISSSSSLPETKPLLRSSSTRSTRSDSLSSATAKVSLDPPGASKAKRKWEDNLGSTSGAFSSLAPPVSIASKRSCSVDSSFSAMNALLQAGLAGQGPALPSPTSSNSRIDAENKRLDLVNALFASQLWRDDNADVISPRLRALLPSSPRRADVLSHMRAMTCNAETWLSELEVFALLQHIDIQIKKVASQKMTPNGTGSAMYLAGGFFPFDAVKRIMDFAKTVNGNKGSEKFNNQIQMDDFLCCLELLESCAESTYPVVSQTLFLLPLEDIFKQIIAAKSNTVSDDYRQGLRFVQQRMVELGWTTFQELHSRGPENCKDYLQAMTMFLPPARLVRSFLRCLHSCPTEKTAPFSSVTPPDNSLPWNRTTLISPLGRSISTPEPSGMSTSVFPPSSIFNGLSQLQRLPSPANFSMNSSFASLNALAGLATLGSGQTTASALPSMGILGGSGRSIIGSMPLSHATSLGNIRD